MKPTNLRLSTVPIPSHNAFFTPAYKSQLSPLPEKSASAGSESQAGSSTASQYDPQTPLLTPRTMEDGFPLDVKGDRRWRMRSSWRTIGRRLLWSLVVIVILGVMGTQKKTSFHTSSSPASAQSSQRPSSSSFRIPTIPLFPFSSDKQDSASTTPLFNGTNRRLIDAYSDALPLEATLRERLDVWRASPGASGREDEVELGEFTQWNLEQCSTITPQHNTHMIQHSVQLWSSQTRATLHSHRMELINHMEDVLAQNLTEQYGYGRGIVYVAGNADTLRRVKWALVMLRGYGCELPVQIYHFPSEAPAYDDPIRQELQDLGAELVEAKNQERDKGKNKSYHLKAIAVVDCPWREVLYLDSDSIPAKDPTYMFSAPNYQRLGIYFTPDYWKTSANNPIWAIMGVKCRNEWEFETGQIFVDKKLHLDVFLLIRYMLERHDFWFYFSDGDKDIFRWAMLALRKRWAVPGRWVGAAALPSGTASGEFCSHTMLQHDSWGEPLFVHYNLLKQIPSGIRRGYTWGRTKQLPMFNVFPATPATARLGEPLEKPIDFEKRGLGDIDCDMLADADEYGNARAEAQEMIMRRAVRERGVKAKYHGGWISALCIDLEYVDPRSPARQESDRLYFQAEQERKDQADREWEEHVKLAESAGVEPGERKEEVKAVVPDWSDPLEVVHWGNFEQLKDFENQLYDMGFIPGADGF